MARLSVHTILFMLGMSAVEYAATFGEAPWLASLLAWSRLWWYLPLGVAAAASLHPWQRALPIIAIVFVVSSLIGSPANLDGFTRILAPILIGALIGSVLRFITYDGEHHGASTPSKRTTNP